MNPPAAFRGGVGEAAPHDDPNEDDDDRRRAVMEQTPIAPKPEIEVPIVAQVKDLGGMLVQCPICWDNVAVDKLRAFRPCKHAVCEDCIARGEITVCPSCRRPIISVESIAIGLAGDVPVVNLRPPPPLAPQSGLALLSPYPDLSLLSFFPDEPPVEFPSQLESLLGERFWMWTTLLLALDLLAFAFWSARVLLHLLDTTSGITSLGKGIVDDVLAQLRLFLGDTVSIFLVRLRVVILLCSIGGLTACYRGIPRDVRRVPLREEEEEEEEEGVDNDNNQPYSSSSVVIGTGYALYLIWYVARGGIHQTRWLFILIAYRVICGLYDFLYERRENGSRWMMNATWMVQVGTLSLCFLVAVFDSSVMLNMICFYTTSLQVLNIALQIDMITRSSHWWGNPLLLQDEGRRVPRAAYGTACANLLISSLFTWIAIDTPTFKGGAARGELAWGLLAVFVLLDFTLVFLVFGLMRMLLFRFFNFFGIPGFVGFRAIEDLRERVERDAREMRLSLLYRMRGHY